MVSAFPPRAAHVPLGRVGDRALEGAVIALVAGIVLPDLVRTVRRLLPVQSDLLTWGAVGGLILLPLLSAQSRRRALPPRVDPDALSRFEGEGGPAADAPAQREPLP